MSGLDYFLDVLKNKYADFSGRARRSEYWYFVLFNMLAAFAAMAVDAVLGYPILYALVALGTFIPSLAVVVRRLHDTNRSGWWYLIVLVPLFGIIALLVFLCQDSEPNENKWGMNPKNPLAANDDISRHLVD